MKRNLLRIGTILMCAMMMAACSDSNNDGPDPDPDPDPDPNPTEKVELWLVDKIADKAEGGVTYTFKYNDDYTLESVTKSGSETGVFSFVYDEKGRFTETTYYTGVKTTYTYEGNIITLECEDGRPTTLLTLNDKGQLEMGAYQDPMSDMYFFFKPEYDAKGRIINTKMGISMDENVPDEWNVMNSYSYDDKNPMAHSGMLPDWYYVMDIAVPTASYWITPYAIHLMPQNNMTVFDTGEGGTQSDRYVMEYNEEDYPVVWGLADGSDGVMENTIMNISYKVVEIEVE